MTLAARKRRANLHLCAAILCIPLLVLVATVAVTPQYLAYLDSDDGGKDIGFAAAAIVVTAAVGLGVAFWREYWRTKSPVIAATIGFFQGIVGALVPTNMLAVTDEHSMAIPVGLVLFAVVGAALPWWLARAGRRVLWSSIDDELIGSGEEVVVPVRDIARLTLCVEQQNIALKRPGPGGFHHFEELVNVESVSVTESLSEERRDLTGMGDVLTVSPGAVLRVRFSRDEWHVPVDNAEDVARLITGRAENMAALRRALGEEDDDTVEHEWHARRNRTVMLSVDDSGVALSVQNKSGPPSYAAADLDELVSVTVIRIAEDQTRDLTGDDDQVPVTAGEALQFRFDDDTQWLFPVDKAQEIATLITRRAELHRSTLEDDELDNA